MSQRHKIIFEYTKHKYYDDYDIYINYKFNIKSKSFYPDYIVRFKNGVIYEFIYDLEKESNNYDIVYPIKINYVINIYDENNMTKSMCNIMLKTELDIMYIMNINQEYKEKKHNNKQKNWFQLLCREYIKDLINNYSEIFNIIFAKQIKSYMVKISRKNKFPHEYAKNNYIVSFDEYILSDDTIYSTNDTNQFYLMNDKKITFIDKDKCKINYEYIFKNDTTLISYYKKDIKNYDILNIEHLKQNKNMILFDDGIDFHLYYNRTEYILSKSKNNNYFVYDKNNVVCYHNKDCEILDITKLNENTILLSTDLKIYKEYNYLNEFANKPYLKQILELENEDYTEITKYIIGEIKNIE
jgi:hypothetical protein